jgi:hypothetical protein
MTLHNQLANLIHGLDRALNQRAKAMHEAMRHTLLKCLLYMHATSLQHANHISALEIILMRHQVFH